MADEFPKETCQLSMERSGTAVPDYEESNTQRGISIIEIALFRKIMFVSYCRRLADDCRYEATQNNNCLFFIMYYGSLT